MTHLILTRLAGGAAGIICLLIPAVAAPAKKPSNPETAAFTAECSSCHIPYPPRFLPKRSWTALMAGLDGHFGENASLDAEANAKILAYLEKNAADSRGGTNVMGLSPDKVPLRITQTPVWRSIHRSMIARAAFKRPEIKSEANCSACHKEAAQGRFGE